MTKLAAELKNDLQSRFFFNFNAPQSKTDLF